MLSALSQRARVVVLGVVGAVAAFFLFGGASGGHSDGDPLDAVPRDSFLVATVNLTELRKSPLYTVLLGKDEPTRPGSPETPMLNARALGMGKLADACGFDPLSRVDRLALAVPEEGDKGELGVAARVTVTRDELSTCTANLAGKRGDKVVTKDVGSFAVVEDSSSADEAARPRLAYGHGGLLVVGRGAWFDAMLASADGKKPGLREAQAHAAIRSSLTSRDGWHSPTLLVSALLPRSLRDRLKNEMGAEILGANAKAEDNGSGNEREKNVMAGVLGVSGVGLALRAGASGQSTDAAVELVCDNADACLSVEKLILKKRLDWSKELTLRLVGFGPLLDSIEVKRDGGRIRVTAGASADALASTIERVLRLSGRPGRGGGGVDRDDSGNGSSGSRSAGGGAGAAERKPSTEMGGTPDTKDAKSDESIPAPRPSH
jgi:hypothetical protein